MFNYQKLSDPDRIFIDNGSLNSEIRQPLIHAKSRQRFLEFLSGFIQLLDGGIGLVQ